MPELKNLNETGPAVVKHNRKVYSFGPGESRGVIPSVAMHAVSKFPPRKDKETGKIIEGFKIVDAGAPSDEYPKMVFEGPEFVGGKTCKLRYAGKRHEFKHGQDVTLDPVILQHFMGKTAGAKNINFVEKKISKKAKAIEKGKGSAADASPGNKWADLVTIAGRDFEIECTLSTFNKKDLMAKMREFNAEAAEEVFKELDYA